MNFDNYVNLMKGRLCKKRFEHSLRVVDTALGIMPNFKTEPDKVRLAALLHDFAKDMTHQELLTLAGRQGLITCKAEEVQPDLLHGPVGAYLCQEELGITDAEVLDAIRYHTTGHVSMSSLDIIVYLADLIEPGRTYQGVQELRKICERDLTWGLLYAFDYTLQYVLRRKFLIHPLTIEARNWWILMNGGTIWKPKK